MWKSLGLPEGFIKYIFYERVDAIRSMISGKSTDKEIYLAFTRTSPVVITYGPAGLSGSVKMVGFIPRKEYLGESLNELRSIRERSTGRGFRGIINDFLRIAYDEERIDFTALGGLELAMKHSWINIRETHKATLLFFTPPITSYEVRCSVEIHEDGPVWEYLNLMHDVFHRVPGEPPGKHPAYVFRFEEIYDNSATRKGFGRLIWRRSETA